MQFHWMTFTVTHHCTTSITTHSVLSDMTSQIIDDRNPSITYFGEWGQQGMPLENNSTTSYTQQVGSYALFRFSGPASVSVWGTIAPVRTHRIPPKVSFQVDSDATSIYVANLDASTQYRQMFFNTMAESSALLPGSHTLNMTSLVDGGFFFLDYLIVTTPRLASSMSNVISKTQSTSISRGVVVVSTTISPTITPTIIATNVKSVTTTSAFSSQTTPGTRSKAGPIVGGTIGGLVLLAVIFAIIFYFINRLSRPARGQSRATDRPTTSSSQPPSTISPYVKRMDDVLPPRYEDTVVHQY
ncbi:hypothetical protein D9613_008873 [Agrocybe pediades]|uniref:Transmembrane protein n=1 Tax=Agrocybe pediades TaxID=84607 RepID=A0A8H4VP35_9AGAR|nr:hypothetical protein D9613_008873 [Agrocybe pediades]